MIEPMLAMSAKTPFKDKGWIYDRKLDGVRCVAYLDSGSTVLLSRTGKDITHKFPELANLHKQMGKLSAIVDGEIVAKSFKGTQSRVQKSKGFDIQIASKTNPCVFWIFDIMEMGRVSLASYTAIDRRKHLRLALTDSCFAMALPYSEDGFALQKAVLAEGGEGIMAKRACATYQPGRRSPDWLKIKNWVEEEFYIIGCTVGEGRRAGTFGALILAKPVGKKGMEFAGNCGTGFTDHEVDVLNQLFEERKLPNSLPIDVGEPVKHWIHPLKCEIQHLPSGVEGEDKIRFPSYRRLVK